MAVNLKEVLTSDVVFVGVGLLANDAEVEAFRRTIDSEVILDSRLIAVPLSNQQDGKILKIPRERVLVESTPIRTRIAREYPETIDGSIRAAEIAMAALESTDLQGRVPSVFGHNFHATYITQSGEPAFLYLGKRLFRDPRMPAEWNLLGGQGKLRFSEDDHVWTITLEPRFQDLETSTIYVDINLEIKRPGVPSLDELRDYISMLWDRAQEIINIIDEAA